MATVAVETVAAAALRSRLRTYGKVAVRVSASAWDLLAGRIEGAKVEGRLWESPLGLTARVLDVEVGRVELDLPAVLAQQRIVLRNVPVGSARVVFNARDFGAFLQHPLVLEAARRAVQGRPFLFDRDGVVVVPGPGPSAGCVMFSGTLPASGERFQLTMRPTQGGRAAQVVATPVPGGPGIGSARQQQQPRPPQQARGAWVPSRAAAVSSAATPSIATTGSSMASAGSSDEDPLVSGELSRFFTNLLVDLQGAELAFQGLRITAATCAGAPGAAPGGAHGAWGRSPGSSSGVRPGMPSTAAAEGVLELDLRATVRSFPPLTLEF